MRNTGPNFKRRLWGQKKSACGKIPRAQQRLEMSENTFLGDKKAPAARYLGQTKLGNRIITHQKRIKRILGGDGGGLSEG